MTPGCPRPDELERFAHGLCDADGAARISAHAALCAACGAWVAEATRDEALLAELRLGGTGPRPEPLAPPAGLVPGCDLVREVYRGGQGVVYEAVQRSTRRRVAVKLLHGGAFAGPRERARFEREVEALAAVRHPGVVAVHESGEAAGCFYCVMDFIDGSPLPTRPAPIDQTMRLFRDVCDAVGAAHLVGVIHRDLKPSNVLVDGSGRPHVLDFGLARRPATDRGSTVTEAGQFVGSAPWASPEQAAGAASLDLRTDVYSLGAILYQMLTGRVPHESDGPIHEVLRRIATADAPRPRALRPEIPRDAEAIVLKCLSRRRDERYESAVALARDLDNWLEGRAVLALSDSRGYLLRRALRRYRVPVAIASGLVVAVTGVAVGMTVLYGQATAARRETDRQQRALLEEIRVNDRSQRFLSEVRRAMEDARRGGPAPTEVLSAAARRAGRMFADDPETRALADLGLVVMTRRFDLDELQASLVTDAADALSSIPFDHPRLVNLHLQVARSLLEAGLTDTAGELIDRITPPEPVRSAAVNAHILHTAARIAEARGDAATALTLADRSLAIALAEADRASDLGRWVGSLAALLEEQAELRDRLGVPDPEACLRSAVDLQSRPGSNDELRRAATLHQLGRWLVDHGRHAEAIAPAREALRIRSDHFGSAQWPLVRESAALVGEAEAPTRSAEADESS